jgi:menaquinone-dependent protoporphyrinogen IX oxidase
LPTALLSVSLSQAGAQDTSAPPDRRSQAVADVKSMLTTFLAETRWHPTLAVPVAGALMYSK